MSGTRLLTTTSPIGLWVDELMRTIFFQSDDALATQAFEQYVSSDIVVRINQDRVPFEQYRASVEAGRARALYLLQSSTEVQSWSAADGAGSGCAAHVSHFTIVNKDTGLEQKASSLTLANVAVRNGKRILVDLEEIANGYA